MAKFSLRLLLTLLVACGGHKASDTTVDPGRTGGGSDGDIIPPEKMDEVDQSLRRRSTQISHCLAVAINGGEVKRGTRGRITYAIRIGTDGHAASVSVVKSEIETQSVVDCATTLVKDTSFPTLPKSYETSFTYGLDAN